MPFKIDRLRNSLKGSQSEKYPKNPPQQSHSDSLKQNSQTDCCFSCKVNKISNQSNLFDPHRYLFSQILFTPIRQNFFSFSFYVLKLFTPLQKGKRVFSAIIKLELIGLP